MNLNQKQTTNKANNLSSLLGSNLVNLDNLKRNGPVDRWGNVMSNEMNSNNIYF